MTFRYSIKKCSSCGEEKGFDAYSKQKAGKFGLKSVCRDCSKIKKDVYNHTRIGIISSIYGDQRKSSRIRGHAMPDYSNSDLRAWAMSQINFDALYLNWVNSGYDKLKKPSCDRLDDYKHYSLDNLRIVTWGENERKGNSDRKRGINNKISKAVIKMDKFGAFIEKYPSISFADRENGVDFRNISMCCLGHRKHAGGFQWKYADE